MSETICYEQAHPPEGKLMQAITPTAPVFVLEMSKAFPLPSKGALCWELDKTAIDRLEGMAACYGTGNKYQELVIAIRRLGSIRVWRADGEKVEAGPDVSD